METFEVEITETLQNVITVKAKSEDEAMDIVYMQYKKGIIELDDSNYVDTDITIFLYSENHKELFENENFKEFILKNAELSLVNMSVEELTKLAFGDISYAKKMFYENQE